MTDTLRTALVQSDTGPPSRYLFVLHGIYGRGRNWTTVARDLVRRRPEWACVLIDLRGHGGSPDAAPPHTVASAADDVSGTEAALGVRATAVAGHSFGGKVALMLADGRQPLEQVWVIDSTPEARIPDGSAWGMIEAIRSLPADFTSRADATAGLMSRGYAEPVAAWMSSNLVLRDGRYRWRLDFDLMEALLRDFFDRDLWHIVESPPPGCVIHFVKASESSTLTEAACRRIEAAAVSGRVRLHRITSGHWVNADNPNALVALMAEHLPGTVPRADLDYDRSRKEPIVTYYGGKELAASFRTVRKHTLQVAEDIPAESYGFVAAEGVRDVASMLVHIAIAPRMFWREVHEARLTTLQNFDFAGTMQRMAAEEKQPRDKAAILELLETEGESFAAFLESMGEEDLAQTVGSSANPDRARSRFEMLMGAKEHEMHHRAQLMLIERQLGIVPHLTRQMSAMVARLTQPKA